MKADTTHTHKLNLRDLPQTKSQDRIFVRFARIRSAYTSAAEGRTVHSYDVLNMTERTASEVDFFTTDDGQKFGRCNCEARVICKHLTKSVIIHVARMRALLEAEAAQVPHDTAIDDDKFWQNFARS